MLADVLSGLREQAVGEVERRAATVEGPGMPSIARRQRLNLLFDDLIAALRRIGADEPPPSITMAVDPTVEREERELARRYVLEAIEQHLVEASPAEMVTVVEWTCTWERHRLREENRPWVSRSGASKRIETQFCCTNVPKRPLTVAEALSLLRAATASADDVRLIRRALLEVLSELDETD
jgi:hypothetical protein